MGEIVIKVPGDVREEIELKEEKFDEVLKRLGDLLFLVYHYPKIKHSIEVEEVAEEEVYLQGD